MGVLGGGRETSEEAVVIQASDLGGWTGERGQMLSDCGHILKVGFPGGLEVGVRGIKDARRVGQLVN